MHSKLGHKIHGVGHRLGNKLHSAYRQGAKFMNKPVVKGALLMGAAVAGAVASGRENKQLTQLQSNTNINNTGVGADYFRVPNAPGVKPFTEEAFPTMTFRE
tara:strand:+ start:2479 stop:2784 length:306 start_codon:yes stop_codon:yes gene_type:complete